MRKVLTVVAALIVIAILVFGVLRWVSDNNPPAPVEPTTSAAPEPGQPDWCPEVEVIAAPGTWESNPADDPITPRHNPNALLLGVTAPLQQQYAPDHVKVWTLPYTAQFKNIDALQEMSYDDSRAEGLNRLTAEMLATHRDCPLTDYILIGFSQGAIIAGDIANTIGTAGHPLPPERIRGVALIADGRRMPGEGVAVGTPVPGVGAEISLEPVKEMTRLVMPGATMRGPRPGGFGDLNHKVVEICAPEDHICSAPTDITDALTRGRALIDNSGVHAQYATNMAVFGSETTPQWLVNWANGLINQPPAPAPAPAPGNPTPVTGVPPIPTS